MIHWGKAFIEPQNDDGYTMYYVMLPVDEGVVIVDKYPNRGAALGCLAVVNDCGKRLS